MLKSHRKSSLSLKAAADDPLYVAVPPNVELTPNMEEVHMEIGQKITLQCDAEGKPEPDVVWTLPDPDELTVSGHV